MVRSSLLIAAPRACMITAMVFSASVATAQSPQTPVPSANPSVQSDPHQALSDPRVTRCLFLGLRRQDPALDGITAHVEKSAMLFEIAGVTEAVAACRAAIEALPAEPKVIIAHYNAVEAISLLLFGFKDMPSTDEDGIAKARALAAKETGSIFGKLIGMYLGTAYEYGVGVAADKTQAIRWYRQAADAGDANAKKELDRLSAADVSVGK